MQLWSLLKLGVGGSKGGGKWQNGGIHIQSSFHVKQKVSYRWCLMPVESLSTNHRWMPKGKQTKGNIWRTSSLSSLMSRNVCSINTALLPNLRNVIISSVWGIATLCQVVSSLHSHVNRDSFSPTSSTVLLVSLFPDDGLSDWGELQSQRSSHLRFTDG